MLLFLLLSLFLLIRAVTCMFFKNLLSLTRAARACVSFLLFVPPNGGKHHHHHVLFKIHTAQWALGNVP